MDRILDGKIVAKKVKEDLKKRIIKPVSLSVFLIGEDPASEIYIANKRKACEEVGIESELQKFSADTKQSKIIDALKQVESDGVLVQLPLPLCFDRNSILKAIDPCKDVDCFHPENCGLLMQGSPRFVPCTPAGIVEILKFYKIPIKGANVVIINRSIVVGQPLSLLLAQNASYLSSMLSQDAEHANATVTLCHEHTKNLGDICRNADIIVTAVGKRPKFSLSADMVKSGAVVIDVGISRIDGKIKGDAEEDVLKKAWVTPSIGGVGPCTVAMLLRNTVEAWEKL